MRRLLGYVLIVVSLIAWFFPSDIVRLIAKQRPVLFGMYSEGHFGALFFGTLILWGLAALLISSQEFGKAMLGKVITVVVAAVLTLTAVTWGSKFIVAPRYVEQDVATAAQNARLELHGVVRHRPPNTHYDYTYIDKPKPTRSYPNAPQGYPPVHIDLNTDSNGYRNKGGLQEYDILAIGDSFTAGSHVSDGQTWPVLLAVRTGRTVYNMGVSGADPHEYINNLAHMGLQYKPKIVVVMIYEGNDFRETKFANKSEDKVLDVFVDSLKESPVARGLKILSQRYFETFNADAEVPEYHKKMSWMPLDLQYSANATPGAKTSSQYYSFKPKRLNYLNVTENQFRQSANWLAVVEILKNIKRISEREGFRLIIAFAPSKPHVVMEAGKDHIPAEQLHRFLAYKEKKLPPADELKQGIYSNLDSQENVIRAFCEEQGMRFVSTTKPLQKKSVLGVQPYYTYNQHWTPDGNRIVAETIAAYLKQFEVVADRR